ncbi:MAG: DUF996 domain-containing protein [Candidatus Bathyarchaeia archaeon]
MNFETSKNLSGVGAILLFVSPIVGAATGFATGVLGLIGFILLLIGAYGLAQYYREAGIFNNILYGTIVGIVGGIVAVVVAAWAAISMLPELLEKIYPTWNGDWTTLPNMTPDTSNLAIGDFSPFLGIIFAVVVIVFIVTIIMAIFYRKSLTMLSAKTGIGLFGTTGTILLIGAVLTIIFIGAVLVWVAMLLLAIAFFQTRPPPPQPSMPTENIPPM